MQERLNVVILGKGRQAQFYKKIICKNKRLKILNFKKKDYLLEDYSRKKIDLFVIAEPTIHHFQILNYLLSKNFNILCEKPFCSNYRQAKKIFEKSKKYNCIFSLGYQFRFESYVQFIKKLIDNNDLGKIRSVKVDWVTNHRAPHDRVHSFKNTKKYGGVFKEFACHVFDYCRWFFDKELLLKKYFAVNNIKYLRDKNNKLKKCDGYDYCEILLRNNLDINFYIKINNFGIKASHKIYIEGEKGFCSVIQNYPFRQKDIKINYKIKNLDKTHYKNFFSFKDSRVLSTKKLLKKIIINILKKKDNLIPKFKDGLYIHKIIKNIHEKKNKSFS
jgi:predicted dehydrogenase